MKINGNIFKRKKRDTDKEGVNYPVMQGNGKDETGAEFDIAAWEKLDKNKNRYLSLCIKPRVKKEEFF